MTAFPDMVVTMDRLDLAGDQPQIGDGFAGAPVCGGAYAVGLFMMALFAAEPGKGTYVPFGTFS